MAEQRPRFTPPSHELKQLGHHACELCGCRAGLHDASGHCFTSDELAARRRFQQQHGRWPDDGEEDTP
jgi:hypothetical protein